VATSRVGARPRDEYNKEVTEFSSTCFATEEGVISHILLSSTTHLIGFLSSSIGAVHEFILVRFIDLVIGLNLYVDLPITPYPFHSFALASKRPS
jgi:hypothetical protein